jgi:flagellar biogenesis protein FliO
VTAVSERTTGAARQARGRRRRARVTTPATVLIVSVAIVLCAAGARADVNRPVASTGSAAAPAVRSETTRSDAEIVAAKEIVASTKAVAAPATGDRAVSAGATLLRESETPAARTTGTSSAAPGATAQPSSMSGQAPDPMTGAVGVSPFPAEPAPSLGFFRVTAALFVTLACVFIVAAILKRSPLAGRAGVLRLESRLPLAKGGALAVVRVEDRRMVVGITPGQINLIAELSAPESEGAPTTLEAEKTGPFDRVLGAVLRRAGGAR